MAVIIIASTSKTIHAKETTSGECPSPTSVPVLHGRLFRLGELFAAASAALSLLPPRRARTRPLPLLVCTPLLNADYDTYLGLRDRKAPHAAQRNALADSATRGDATGECLLQNTVAGRRRRTPPTVSAAALLGLGLRGEYWSYGRAGELRTVQSPR